MKKFIINIFLLFAIVLVTDYSVGIIGDYLQTHARGGTTKRINDLVMNDKHDVIILGSSRARHHYDTPYLSDTLGVDVYNAGFDGNGVVLAYGLLSLVFERYKPDLIVYDVEPFFDIYQYAPDNNHKRYISVQKSYFRNETIGSIIRDISLEEWYKVHSGLLRYNSKLFIMGIDYLQTRYTNSCGFEPIYGEYAGGKVNNGEEEYILDSFKLSYLEKLILLSEKYKTTLVFVVSPRLGQENSAAIQPAIELCKRYNILFIDDYANPEFMMHQEWFKDPKHLNSKGARIFSRRMVAVFNKFLKKKNSYNNERD